MACTRAIGIARPSSTSAVGNCCGAGSAEAQGSKSASSAAAFRMVKSAGDTSSSESQPTGNETGAPGRTRGL